LSFILSNFRILFSNLFFLSFKLNLILNVDDNVAILETQVTASGGTVTEDITATTEQATITVAIDVEYIILISMFFLLLSMIC